MVAGQIAYHKLEVWPFSFALLASQSVASFGIALVQVPARETGHAGSGVGFCTLYTVCIHILCLNSNVSGINRI